MAQSLVPHIFQTSQPHCTIRQQSTKFYQILTKLPSSSTLLLLSLLSIQMTALYSLQVEAALSRQPGKHKMKPHDTVTSIYTTYMKDVVAYLKTKKISVSSMSDLSDFGDLAICNAFAGLPIPGGVDPTSQYYQDLKFSYDWTMANQYTAQVNQTQITAIDLFEDVLNIMDKVIAGKSTLKYSMYSAHDVTLLPLLNILGVVNTTCLLDNYVAKKANQTLPYPNCVFPGFTANLAFELYGGSSPSVKVLYNGNVIKICSDAYSCGLTAFRADIETKTNYTYNNANFKLPLCNLMCQVMRNIHVC